MNHQSPGIFITGTDTDVGKTYVGRCIAAYLSLRGARVGVVKPFESGLDDSGGVPTDAVSLAEAAACQEPLETICPYQYRKALAPGIAAWTEEEADWKSAVGAVSRMRGRADFVLVEGAGGLMVPLAGDKLVLDLARESELPVLVVAANRLGVINHTVLTLDKLRAAGLPVAGVVLNGVPGGETGSAATNPVYLKQAMGVPLVGVIPVQETRADRPALAEIAATHLDLDGLLARIAPNFNLADAGN